MESRYDLCLTEEEQIDFVLGALAADRSAGIERHLHGCPDCRRALTEWKHLLLQKESAAPTPPAAIKRRLRRRIALGGLLRGLLRRPAPTIATCAVVTLCLCLFGLWNGTHRLKQPYDSALQVQREAAPELMAVAGTKRVEVVPTAPDVAGYAWVNADRRELLLLLEGIVRDKDKAYEVWMEQGGVRSQLGVMDWTAGTAHLHYQGDRVPQAERLTVSVESAYGSGAQPGPELAWVRLR